MPFSDYPLRTITLPQTAGSNDPRIVIGPDIPADLVTFYAPDTLVACQLFYENATHYTFVALVFDSLSPDNLFTTTGSVVNGHVNEITWMFNSGVAYDLNDSSFDDGTFEFGRDRGHIIGGAGSTFFYLSNDCDFVIGRATGGGGGVSQPRGMLDAVSSAANSAAVGAEAVVLTGNSITWRDGRVCEVEFMAFTDVSNANNLAHYAIRKTNLAGAVIAVIGHATVDAAGVGFGDGFQHAIRIGRAHGAGDLAANIVLTLQLAAGVGTCTSAGNATAHRWLTVKDVGDVSDYPDAYLIA